MTKIYVNPIKNDFVLRPDDIVYVHNKGYVGVVNIAEYITKILAPFNSAIGEFANLEYARYYNDH